MCPFCGSNFEIGEMYLESDSDLLEGYIKCECSRFPILSGILILKNSSINDILIRLLDQRRFEEATRIALERYSEVAFKVSNHFFPSGQFSQNFKNIIIKLLSTKSINKYNKYVSESVPFEDLLGGGNTDVYLKNRFSAESFWSLYPFIPMLNENRDNVLDLCCGVGQSSFLISKYVRPETLTCADHSFESIYIAKKYFAKDANHLCLDANYRLPFKNDSFSSIIILDAIHYVLSRSSLVSEMERVVSSKGLMLLLHVHNRLANNVSAGMPLSPTGWAHLFKQCKVKVLSERRILDDFLNENKIDINRDESKKELDSSNAIVLLGTKADTNFYRNFSIWDAFTGDRQNLIINPLYKICPKSDRIILKREFPSEFFRNEYPTSEGFLPEMYELNGRISHMLQGRSLNIISRDLTTDEENIIKNLIERFILLDIPTNIYK